MCVPKDLNLHVPGRRHKLFNEHDVIAERLDALSFGRLQLGLELSLCHGDAHTFATAATHGLDHDGVADFAGLGFQAFNALVLAVIASEKLIT